MRVSLNASERLERCGRYQTHLTTGRSYGADNCVGRFHCYKQGVPRGLCAGGSLNAPERLERCGRYCLILAGAEHDKGTCFDGFNAFFFGHFFQLGIFGTGIEDDALWMKREYVVVIRFLITRVEV